MSEKSSQSSSVHSCDLDQSLTSSHSAIHAARLFLTGLVILALGALYYISVRGNSMNNIDLSRMSRAELERISLEIAEQLHFAPTLERREKKFDFLHSTATRVLIGIGVSAVLNVVAITGHHIVQKVRRSTNLYRSVEHVVSPF